MKASGARYKSDISAETCQSPTVKFLKIGTPELIRVIIPKLVQFGFAMQLCVAKEAAGMTNSADPDQTAPHGAV